MLYCKYFDENCENEIGLESVTRRILGMFPFTGTRRQTLPYNSVLKRCQHEKLEESGQPSLLAGNA